MYLITIEGGDGSGKGLATKVVSEVLSKEFSFAAVEIPGSLGENTLWDDWQSRPYAGRP